MASQTETLQLNEADIAFLLNLLREAEGPMTTDELVAALKTRES